MPLLGLVLPSRCAGCDVPGRPLCAGCRDRLIRLAPPVCERCGCPGAWPVRRCVECRGRRLAFLRARAAIVYDERARRIVSAWKERGRRDLAAALAAVVVEVVARPTVEAVTFVPGDAERTRERSHVPAARLAHELALLWDVPWAPFLKRVGTAPRQARLPRSARGANVRGAFVATARPPPSVVLVDDVYTTGSTATACATVLRRAGARSVEVVCLARAVR